jgi:hypothetical protein
MAVATFALTLAVRVWGIDTHFWMLRDQVRDWELALGPFRELPLVGPATHVGGYTIGPAFYWILWAIRVTVGPWFDHLPHGGGVGQAMLQSAVDVLLLFAVWRRTGSVWLALAAIVLLTTSSFDLHFAAVIWNPVVGSTLAKLAIALVLLEWHRGHLVLAAATVAVAWSAVHAYTGAVFVAVGVLAALVLDPLAHGDRRLVRRNLAVILVVVALLQVPYLLHQIRYRFSDEAMGAVVGSARLVLTGQAPPEIAKSVAGYVEAVRFSQVAPWTLPRFGWILLCAGVVVLVRYRRDPALLAVLLLPQALAIAGYSLFLADLDHYYYLSLMPPVVLTVLLALTALPWRRAAAAMAVAALLASAALIPGRLHFRTKLDRWPEYGAVLTASRRIVAVREPMRALVTEFDRPPSADPEFMYRILGGRIDRRSPWVATITADGRVTYRAVTAP